MLFAGPGHTGEKNGGDTSMRPFFEPLALQAVIASPLPRWRVFQHVLGGPTGRRFDRTCVGTACISYDCPFCRKATVNFGGMTTTFSHVCGNTTLLDFLIRLLYVVSIAQNHALEHVHIGSSISCILGG